MGRSSLLAILFDFFDDVFMICLVDDIFRMVYERPGALSHLTVNGPAFGKVKEEKKIGKVTTGNRRCKSGVEGTGGGSTRGFKSGVQKRVVDISNENN